MSDSFDATNWSAADQLNATRTVLRKAAEDLAGVAANTPTGVLLVDAESLAKFLVDLAELRIGPERVTAQVVAAEKARMKAMETMLRNVGYSVMSMNTTCAVTKDGT